MDSGITIENIIQFILLLSGLFAGFIRFNNKTEKKLINDKPIRERC